MTEKSRSLTFDQSVGTLAFAPPEPMPVRPPSSPSRGWTTWGGLSVATSILLAGAIGLGHSPATPVLLSPAPTAPIIAAVVPIVPPATQTPAPTASPTSAAQQAAFVVGRPLIAAIVMVGPSRIVLRLPDGTMLTAALDSRTKFTGGGDDRAAVSMAGASVFVTLAAGPTGPLVTRLERASADA